MNQNDDGDICLDMISCIKLFKPVELSRTRKKETNSVATPTEVTAYKSLCGVMNFLGASVLPQASLAASLLQQRVSKLTVDNMREANKVVAEILKLSPLINYRHQQPRVTNACIQTFSDASFNIKSNQDYGQSGIITGLSADTLSGDSIYHVLDWSSQKQRRASNSTYGAEILACVDADDRGFHLKQAFHSLFPMKPLRHILNVDSRCLYDTVTTLHEGKEYRLRQTIQRIRNSFESTELDILRWIPGPANISDALTKRKLQLYATLNKICTTGRLLVNFGYIFSLERRTWK